jgi:hypothetical protein
MILINRIIDITNIILIFDDIQYYILFVFLLILISILLAANICKSNNNFCADNELRIINRFPDILFLFLYDVIVVIVFFYI